MKKLFTLILTASAFLWANAETCYILKSIDTPEMAEYTTYEWDMEKLLTTRIDDEGDNVTYTTFEYDETGRIIAEEQFLEIYEGRSEDYSWMRANRIEYGYDETTGNLTQMTIINLPDTPGFISITFLILTYDEQNTLTKITAYFGDTVDTPQADWRLFAEIDYTFNDRGQRATATRTVHSFGSTYLFVLQEFYYDQEGRLRVIRDREPIEGSTTPMTRSNRVYEYTANGALETLYTTDSAFRFNTTDDGLFSEVVNVGNPSKRQEFIYDDGVSAEYVLYAAPSPYSRVYIGDDVMSLLKGKVIMEMLYERPYGDDYDLVHFCTRDYSYYTVDREPSTDTGIADIVAKPMTLFRAKAEGNELTVSGNVTDTVNIYDLNGRLMQTSNAKGGKVNISRLESGVYVATSGLAAAKFVRLSDNY